MDWELKASSAWDFTELDKQDDPHLAALVESNSLDVHNKNGGGFLIDLGFGGLGDPGDGSVDKLKEPRGSTISSSPSGSSKGTRAISRTQNASCSVDGCTADLGNCRDYYRRHRVCEGHSKAPIVIVDSKEQRFCQQCSRFQSLGEFDAQKRSCRKRLEGHNRRRRKPQPEAFYMSSGSYSSNHQGARLVFLSGPQAHPSPTSIAGAIPTWPRVANHRHQGSHVTDRQSTIPNSSSCIYNGVDKRFPFLLANDPERTNQVFPGVSIGQRSVNSERALSLLSSHSQQSFEPSSSHLLERDAIQPSQPIGIGWHCDGLAEYWRSQRVEEKPPPMVPHHAGNTNNLWKETFQVAPDDLFENEASQVLPFSWR